MDASLMAWEHYVPVAEEGGISDTVDGGNNERSQLNGPKALSVVQRLDTLKGPKAISVVQRLDT